jgi:hypothetical protein
MREIRTYIEINREIISDKLNSSQFILDRAVSLY